MFLTSSDVTHHGMLHVCIVSLLWCLYFGRWQTYRQNYFPAICAAQAKWFKGLSYKHFKDMEVGLFGLNSLDLWLLADEVGEPYKIALPFNKTCWIRLSPFIYPETFYGSWCHKLLIVQSEKWSLVTYPHSCPQYV